MSRYLNQEVKILEGQPIWKDKGWCLARWPDGKIYVMWRDQINEQPAVSSERS